ncbi:hypothetical protein [Neobacillus sp. 114]
MAQIIAADVFTSASGRYVAAKCARVIVRNIAEYEIV